MDRLIPVRALIGCAMLLLLAACGDDTQNDMQTLAEAGVLERPNDMVLGNPDGDVTIIEIFDYLSPGSRAFVGSIDRLMDCDKQVRIVPVVWPQQNDSSRDLAKLSLAARDQHRFGEFHELLLHASRPSSANQLPFLEREAGLQPQQLDQSATSMRINAELAQQEFALRNLQITELPTFYVLHSKDPLKHKAIRLAMPTPEELNAAVQEIRIG